MVQQWSTLQTLFVPLHCLARSRLSTAFGAAHVNLADPIPAHLLGSMAGTDWTPLFDLLAAPLRLPDTEAKRAASVGASMQAQVSTES